MATYPTLSIPPSYPINETIEDSTISSNFETGWEQTRPRFTRSRRTWQINYENLLYVDKKLLEDFVNDDVRQGADYFTWTHPVTSEVVTVRFKPAPTYNNTILTYWQVSFSLREV